jgi:gliding motility-associated-like protein
MKKLTYKSVLFTILALSATLQGVGQVPFICDGRFFMTQVFQTNSALVEVDIDPLTQEVVFNTINGNLGVVINGIGYRSEENLIYGVEPRDHFLFQLDATGNLVQITRLDLTRGFFYLGADITPDGQFLVLIGSTDVNGLPADVEMAYVDLLDPNYGVTKLPLKGALVNMLDIAFDPTDDQLYAFDSGGNRLVKILPDGTVVAPYDPSPLLDNAGSVFFDVFGDLFAYGSPVGAMGFQNTLYAVDKNTGVFRILTTGARARATDACSCPYSVEIRKLVTPETSFPCGRVQYAFEISNLSTRSQAGLTFEDVLPPGFTISAIIKNPFEGNITSGVGTQTLQITDMVIPAGGDTIIIEVDLDDLPPGIYKNQAQLFGLPVGLGETRVSDDPRTLPKRDSTSLIIAPIGFDTMTVEELVCLGDGLVLDPSAYGVNFLWSDGSTSPTLEVDMAGVYVVEAASLCDTVTIIYEVRESLIDVSVFAEATEIELGESIQLSSSVSQTGDSVFYFWDDPFEQGSLSCRTCPDPLATPIGDATYLLTVTDEQGCTNSDFISIQVDSEHAIYTGNVFSPNGDSVNDIFYIQGKGRGEIFRFDIYNRWGGLVFSAPPGGFVNDSDFGWNGRINNRYAEPAVYTWVADVRYLDNTSEVLGGDLTLMR